MGVYRLSINMCYIKGEAELAPLVHLFCGLFPV